MYPRQRAHIAHSIPGRIRIVIPAQRHCAHFFARLEQHVLSAQGVYGVCAKPAAASIVIHHGPGSNCLAICASILQLDLAGGVRGERVPAPAVLVTLRAANSRVHELTGGRFDLASLLARVLLFVVRKHALAKIVELIAEPLLRLLLTEPAVERQVEYHQLALAA